MKRTHCVFVYATKAARQAGEMEYTVDADSLDEANEIAQQEIEEGMYCASIYQRMPHAAPMQFVGAHILPQAPAAMVAAEA
jgi:menaquinone-dependent protoporphyrinogen IX oxidase